jgi:hypothetical protein
MPATSFRNGIYPAYKANRESPPADLERQFALCREFCRHMGVAEYASAEYEADDIIGTLAARSRAAGLRNVLVTRDKDLSQLIRDGDVFWDYSGKARYHYHDIGPRFGAIPELIADFLALTGDSVDNIPGVPGVGKKTAALLFSTFGSLDELYENLHPFRIEIARRRRPRRQASRAQASRVSCAAIDAHRVRHAARGELGRFEDKGARSRQARPLFRYAWFRQYIEAAGASNRRCMMTGELRWPEKTLNPFCRRSGCFRRPASFASRPLKANDLERMYAKAADDYVGFWADLAVEEIDWTRPFSVPLDDSDAPNYRWFSDGQLNVSHNCLDVHLPTRGDKVAIVFEGEQGDVRKLTYAQLHGEVCRFANALKAKGMSRGDRVVIYMPLIPEAVIAMQACARIGAIHSVVFGGFSANAVKDRIEDAGAKLVITADGGWRGGHVVELKRAVDKALAEGCPAWSGSSSTSAPAPRARCGRAATSGGTMPCSAKRAMRRRRGSMPSILCSCCTPPDPRDGRRAFSTAAAGICSAPS